MEQRIYIVGMNHRHCDVHIRERFALSDPVWSVQRPIPTGLSGEHLDEVAVISTCNRVDCIAVGRGETVPETVLKHWSAAVGEPVDELRGHVYILQDLAAIEHLFRVASSLDSMIIGEPQILGQVKDAFRLAVEQGTAKTILNRLFHKAFSTAKLIRTETEIAAHAVSVSFAACELAKRIFGDMHKRSALLIGAGEMAELAAAHLVKAGINSLTVCNRTASRAEELAREFSCRVLPFASLAKAISEADVVISSTGAQRPIIDKEMAAAALRQRRDPIFFIDIAVPRDIDPAVQELNNAYVYDLDDLKNVVTDNLALRESEAVKAQELVAREVAAFNAWLESLELAPTISDLVKRNERIAEEELAKTLRRLGAVSETTEAALRDLVAGILKKVHHEPIVFLKTNPMGKLSRLQYVSLVRRMFNLDENRGPEGNDQ